LDFELSVSKPMSRAKMSSVLARAGSEPLEETEDMGRASKGADFKACDQRLGAFAAKWE
jgi:hypothetical protein